MLKHFSPPLNISFVPMNMILEVRNYGVEMWYDYMGVFGLKSFMAKISPAPFRIV